MPQRGEGGTLRGDCFDFGYLGSFLPLVKGVPRHSEAKAGEGFNFAVYPILKHCPLQKRVEIKEKV
jgi:hypothetical protein